MVARTVASSACETLASLRITGMNACCMTRAAGKVHHLAAHPDACGLVRADEVAEEAARHGLKHLLAPALRLLHGRARGRINRKQRRFRHELVEEAGDLAAALHLPPVDLERGDRLPVEAGEPHEQRVKARHELHDAVPDPLVPEHRHARGGGVRDRYHM
jgi:hypothetical protein